MTQIKDLNSIAYDGAYFVPIQKADGMTGKILISAIGGSLSAWQLKTSSYTAVAGDRLRINASAGDVVITLPASPTATDADILFQRLDLGTNKVLLRTGANKFNTQANQDAVFAPPSINLIEGVSYVNSAIGWLNQHNRLSFQAYTAPISTAGDPLFSSVVLLMPMNTASGITDIKGKVTTNQGAAQSTAIFDPFGNNAGVMSFAGGGVRISVAQSNDFAFTNGAFAVEFWAYPTSTITGVLSGLFDTRAVSGDSGWNFSLDVNNQIYTNALSNFNGDEPSGKILPIGSWSYVCISRDATTSINRTSINGVGVTSGYNRNPSIISPGNLIIGDIINTVSPYEGSFTGYMSNLRITRAYRDGSIVPTAPFPIS